MCTVHSCPNARLGDILVLYLAKQPLAPGIFQPAIRERQNLDSYPLIQTFPCWFDQIDSIGIIRVQFLYSEANRMSPELASTPPPSSQIPAETRPAAGQLASKSSSSHQQRCLMAWTSHFRSATACPTSLTSLSHRLILEQTCWRTVHQQFGAGHSNGAVVTGPKLFAGRTIFSAAWLLCAAIRSPPAAASACSLASRSAFLLAVRRCLAFMGG